MFARHGGATEAHESGADLVDIGKHAQHRDLNTTSTTSHHRSTRHDGQRGRAPHTGRGRTKHEKV